MQYNQDINSRKALCGKVALITGASRGLGRAIAEELAENGAKLVIAARGKKDLYETEKIISYKTEVLSLTVDITKEKDVKSLIQKSIEKFGKIDILINNAGIYADKDIVDMPLSEWNNIISTNLSGVFLCTKEVTKRMISQGSGKIVIISSVAGKFASKGHAAYCASKFGVIGFGKSLAKEVNKYHISVSIVCPSAINTTIFGKYKPHVPKNVMLKPEKVAKMVYKAILSNKKMQLIYIMNTKRVLHQIIRKVTSIFG